MPVKLALTLVHPPLHPVRCLNPHLISSLHDADAQGSTIQKLIVNFFGVYGIPLKKPNSPRSYNIL